MDRLDILDKKLRELERKQDFGKYPEYVTNRINEAMTKVMGVIAKNENDANRKLYKLSDDIKQLGAAIKLISAKSDEASLRTKEFKGLIDDHDALIRESLNGFDGAIKANSESIAKMVNVNKQMRSSLMSFFQELPGKLNI